MSETPSAESPFSEPGDDEGPDGSPPALPLAEDVETPIPALRELSVQIVKTEPKARDGEKEAGGEAGEEAVAILEDPEGLAPKPAALSMWAYALASLFDGKRSARQAVEFFERKFGQPIPAEQALALQRELDKALLLYSTRFEKTVARQIRAYLDKSIRPWAHAGTAYPAEPEALRKTVESFFTAPDGPGDPWGEPPARQDTLRALLLPHIDLRIGGATYAHAYAELLKRSQADLFFILGVAHQAPGSALYYVSQKDYATPMCVVKTNRAIARRLQAAVDVPPPLAELTHRTEHSVEFQAALLSVLMERCKREIEIVPILCGPVESFLAEDADPFSAEPFKKFAAALRAELDGCNRRWCVMCSVDLCHVGPEFGHSTMMTERLLPPIERYDRKLLKIIERLDALAVFKEIARTQNSRHVDAVLAVLTMLEACKGILKSGRLLHYDQMLKEGTHGAVSYASMAFET